MGGETPGEARAGHHDVKEPHQALKTAAQHSTWEPPGLSLQAPRTGPTGARHTQPSVKTFAVELFVEIILGAQEGLENKTEGLDDVPSPPPHPIYASVFIQMRRESEQFS